MKKTFRLVYLSLLIAQSLVLFLLEGLLPLPFLAPGAKLGLANLVTVAALYTLPSAYDVLLIVLVRTLLASLFGGGPTVFCYSIAGGLVSLSFMLLLKRCSLFSVIGISAAGGFFHNAGQLLAAMLIMQSMELAGYFPILGTCGTATGILIGFLANFLLRKLPRTVLSPHTK